MSPGELSWVVLCVGLVSGVALDLPCAAATGIRPAMQGVVACVYSMLRSKPGLFSVDVYTVGTERYVIDYTFYDKGRSFTGGVGIYDFILSDGTHLYTNETPLGQADNHGLVELRRLGDTAYEMMDKCHLSPGFDDMLRSQPDPPLQKIEMPNSN